MKNVRTKKFDETEEESAVLMEELVQDLSHMYIEHNWSGGDKEILDLLRKAWVQGFRDGSRTTAQLLMPETFLGINT